MDISGAPQSLADNPCTGICSTTQWGDKICKGCGRSDTEIRDWNALSPLDKKLIVLRTVDEGYRPRQLQHYKANSK